MARTAKLPPLPEPVTEMPPQAVFDCAIALARMLAAQQAHAESLGAHIYRRAPDPEA